MSALNAFSSRTAGVLLHPTSLPCSESCWGSEQENAFGTLGKEAFNFIDFMAAANLTVWQVLPLVPTEENLSPYQSTSVHAGNPDLISLDNLIDRGWLKKESVNLVEKSRSGLAELRRNCAPDFYQFLDNHDQTRKEFNDFCQQEASWLEDFALFAALQRRFNGVSWIDWPAELRNRDPSTLEKYQQELQDDIKCVKFEQFAFFTQWSAVKQYANEKGISVFGDIPIFVGHNSADVWSSQHYFQLDENGKALSLAGVPPDSFSENGQCWGNPHYAWDVMQEDGFQWWLARIGTQMKLFDLIRIDHFRGFHSVYAIPGENADARNGEWVNTPGDALLDACFKKYPDLKLVAENLGTITDEIEALREKYKLPGMIVLHFAFENDSDSPHLPHHHQEHNIVYTGTHDNDTTLGWSTQLNEAAQRQLSTYTYHSSEAMPWLLIDMALASPAKISIIPMQDFLALGSDCRMNMPGTPDQNWRWRFSWDQVAMTLAGDIKQRLASFHRATK